MNDHQRSRSSRFVHAAVSTMLAISVSHAVADAPDRGPDQLLQEFQAPPAAARPRVWWHWMNGNITREGIRLDLEWMKRVGIGGLQNFDAALGTPQVVEQRLAYMTPEWQDAFRYAADLSEQNGLELAIASSAGWSETGGPWVKPEQAMKKLVWSETDLTGGRKFAGRLPQPSAIAGPFQDAPLQGGIEGAAPAIPDFYRDVAVIAYQSSPRKPTRATVRLGSAIIDGTVLNDGALGKGIRVTPGTSADSCLRFDYAQPTRVASVRLGLPIAGDFFHSALAIPTLESSADGSTFHKVAEIPAGGLIQHTASFQPLTARYFRVCFAPPPAAFTDLLEAAAPGVNMDGPLGPPAPAAPAGVNVLELQLLTSAQVHRFEEKAGFAFVPDYYAIASPSASAPDATPRAKVIDVTARMNAAGELHWTPPPGQWRVVRFGYSLTGKQNHPATAEATGLEVDKLDREAVKAYLDTYLARYEKMLGSSRMGAHGLRALLVDSIEVGAQNWTPSLPLEFRRRRGYELATWMPVLTGAVIGSAEESDKFLYDFRRTLAELMSDSHYAQLAESAHERGLTQYGEALEQGRPVLGDDMEMRRHTNVPMAAIWTFRPEKGTPPVRFADIRGAASVAHIYGQNIVAAESLTSAFAPWNFAPRDLKPIIDLAFALGLNRPVIHTSVHQPLPARAPGLTLAIFGQYFNRNETWAEQASAWVSYLARTSYLLQQGRFAADVLYFYGEEAPLTALFGEHLPSDIPRGYGFDFANSDVLLNRVTVRDGALVTESGMSYRVLYLGGSSQHMSLPVLKRLATLVAQGATVVGPRPISSPSLADDPGEFQKLTDELWGSANGTPRRISPDADAETALARGGVVRDVEFSGERADRDIMFVHRRLDDGDLYFLTNRKPREEPLEALFRVTGRQPEIWHAETGAATPVAYRIEAARTRVALRLAPYESCFVVFRRPAVLKEMAIAEPTVTPIAELNSGWTLTFQASRGASTESRAASIGSWTSDADPRVRYFSGTGTYTRTLSKMKLPSGRVFLDLGEVKELAEVMVNGRSLGILWHEPYRVDITDALRPDGNRIEVRVTNLWVNRLIGDAQPGTEKVTFTVAPPYRADAPLRESGLLGPVRLQRQVDGPASTH